MKKLDNFKGFQELNSKELKEVEGGCVHLNIMNIIERDGCRPKGHRWKWFWQDEY